MRTEYDLYHWSTDGAAVCDKDVRRFPTLDGAMLATGYGSPTDWYVTASGARARRGPAPEGRTGSVRRGAGMGAVVNAYFSDIMRVEEMSDADGTR